jgi:Winged helix DNA-binding domain
MPVRFLSASGVNVSTVARADRTPSVERTLTALELNRALLARQHLLARTDAPIPTVLEQMGGLQAQYAPAMYLGLWSRMAELDRDAVTAALVARDVVQATLLRSTIHLVSKADYWPFAIGVRQSRRDWFLRVVKPTPTAAQMEEAAATVRLSLQDGPLRQADLYRLVDPPLRNGIGLWVDLVRVPPSGTWERRRADLYGLAEQWVGPPRATEDQGVRLLVRRYLAGFGPARRTEIADWAGLPANQVATVLAELNLRQFRAEDGAVLYDLPRAPRPDAATPAPVRFLPVWDATLLVHARRTGILPERYRPRIFNTKTPHSFNTFLVDGAVAGTWRFEHGRVELTEFAPLAAAVRRELAEEADRLAAFHA